MPGEAGPPPPRAHMESASKKFVAPETSQAPVEDVEESRLSMMTCAAFTCRLGHSANSNVGNKTLTSKTKAALFSHLYESIPIPPIHILLFFLQR